MNGMEDNMREQVLYSDGLEIRMHPPVPVAFSDPAEKRWGFHQFPAISRLPDNRALLTFNITADDDACLGRPGPAYISEDDGASWTKWVSEDELLTISSSVVSSVNGGEYLYVPKSPAMNIATEKISLPPPGAAVDIYGKVRFHRLSDCDRRIVEYVSASPALRWLPETKRWQREIVRWDTDIIYYRDGSNIVPRNYIDIIVKVGNRLYNPCFRCQYLLPDGSFPRNYACWLLISDDNGRTWKRHGLIAYDNTGRLMMGEPCLAQTTRGDFACVIRCATQEQQPMLIAYSDDGSAWTVPAPLYPFGVLPQLLPLANGVLVLSFGRPGVHIMASPDGSARRWTSAFPIVPGDAGHIHAHSCGYTRMIPLDDQNVLLVYSEFRHDGPQGTCKAILVRRIEFRRVRT